MPTVFSHTVAATALGQWYVPAEASAKAGPQRSVPLRFWIWTVFCAMLPDVDVIGFSLGISYDDILGHRGLTHSFVFAALVGAIAAAQCQIPNPKSQTPNPKRLGLFVYFILIAASHGVLDAFTNGGRGIAFLAPFSNARFFFPWRPIQVSPIGVRFFSGRGVDVLLSELRWIWVPSAIIAAAARLVRKYTSSSRSSQITDRHDVKTGVRPQ